jgi:hypothetical protein
MRVGKAVKFADGTPRLLLRPHPTYGEPPDHADGFWEYSNMDPNERFKPKVRVRKIDDRASRLIPPSARANLKRYDRRVGHDHFLSGLRFDFETVDGEPRYFLVYNASDGGMWDYAYEMHMDNGWTVFLDPMWIRAGYVDGNATVDLRTRRIEGTIY